MSDSIYTGNARAEAEPARPDPGTVLRPLLERVKLASQQRSSVEEGPVNVWAFAAGQETGAMFAALQAALALLEVPW